MHGANFELLLGLLSRLSGDQQHRLRAALEGDDREAAVLGLLEQRLGERPGCPHCGGSQVQRWGTSHGLRR